MMSQPLGIRCRKSGGASAAKRVNVWPLANVCMMLLPFLLVSSPSDVLRVFNIATSPKVGSGESVQLRVGNLRLAVAVGSSIMASEAPLGTGSGFPPEVADALAALARTQPDADIVVQPDASATYADVVSVLDTLHDSAAMGTHRVVVAPVAAP